MDIMFYGGRGSGKTLLAIIHMWLDWIEGAELWSNTPLNAKFPHKYIDTLDIISESFQRDIPNDGRLRTCLIDETHTQADSRTSMSHTNRQLVNFVTQGRKRNFRMLYTSQILTGYDVRMRALTDRVVTCRPTIDINDIGYGNKNYPEPIMFNYLTYIPNEDFRLENRYSIPREIARKFYDLYQTEEPIMSIEQVLRNKQ